MASIHLDRSSGMHASIKGLVKCEFVEITFCEFSDLWFETFSRYIYNCNFFFCPSFFLSLSFFFFFFHKYIQNKKYLSIVSKFVQETITRDIKMVINVTLNFIVRFFIFS